MRVKHDSYVSVVSPQVVFSSLLVDFLNSTLTSLIGQAQGSLESGSSRVGSPWRLSLKKFDGGPSPIQNDAG